MSIFTKILSGGADAIIKTVSDTVDKFVQTPDEKAKIIADATKEVNRHFEALQASSDDIEKAYLQDVQNARALQVAALSQQDNFSKRFLYYLAGFIIFFTMVYGVLLFFLEIPESNKRLIEMFLDIFVFSGSLSVIYFFFGSSKGSHDKTEAGMDSKK